MALSGAPHCPERKRGRWGCSKTGPAEVGAEKGDSPGFWIPACAGMTIEGCGNDKWGLTFFKLNAILLIVPRTIFYYLGLVTQVGLTIIFTLIVSIFIGRYLDQKFNLNGIFTILFIFIGIAAGFYSVYKQIIGK